MEKSAVERVEKWMVELEESREAERKIVERKIVERKRAEAERKRAEAERAEAERKRAQDKEDAESLLMLGWLVLLGLLGWGIYHTGCWVYQEMTQEDPPNIEENEIRREAQRRLQEEEREHRIELEMIRQRRLPQAPDPGQEPEQDDESFFGRLLAGDGTVAVQILDSRGNVITTRYIYRHTLGAVMRRERSRGYTVREVN